MSEPNIALLVPCRNGAPFLRRLVESARAQTRAFAEFIVFDDGSTDDSAQVARALGATVIQSPVSLGPSAARNRLAAAARSEWLHFHDADDIMDARYVELVMPAASGKATLVICDMRWVDDRTGDVVGTWRYDEAEIAKHPVAYFLCHTMGGINGLFRADRFLSLGGFDESLHYWEDLDLAIRWANAGEKIAVIPHQLVTAYRRTDSHANSNLTEVWQVKLQLMRRVLSDAAPDVKATIAREAETVATRLGLLGAWSQVPLALELSVEAGGDPPTTHSRALRSLKQVLPRSWLFRLQHQRRRVAQP